MSASHDLLFDCSVSTKRARAPGVMFPGMGTDMGTPTPTPIGPVPSCMGGATATASGMWGCGSSVWRGAPSAALGIAGWWWSGRSGWCWWCACCGWKPVGFGVDAGCKFELEWVGVRGIAECE